MDLHGIGPAGAARILADVGDIARFPDRNHFASWTGTAPWMPPPRLDTEGRAYHQRNLGEAKTRTEARRCLKRRLSDMVYRQLVADAQRADQPEVETGPGGHSGASLTSSAADLHTPVIGSSDQPPPGPAGPTPPVPSPRAKTRAGSAPQPPRRRTGAVRMERSTGRTTLTATSADAPSQAPRPRP